MWNINPAVDSGHPAVMPCELVRRCLVCSSTPGDTVLDPFAGSGTVGRVAQRWGRRFVGVEVDPGHYATAKRRILEGTGGGPGQLFAGSLFDGEGEG